MRELDLDDLITVDRRIAGLKSVGTLVASLRSLSAMHWRRGSAALLDLRSYEESLRKAVASLGGEAMHPMTLAARAPTGRLVIVVGTDQGLTGTLVHRIVRYAVDYIVGVGLSQCTAVAIGDRTAQMLREANVDAIVSLRTPASIDGIGRAVEEIAELAFERMVRGSEDVIEVVYAHHRGSGASQPTRTQVHPVRTDMLLGSGAAAGQSSRPEEREDGHRRRGVRGRYPPRLYEEASKVATALLEEWTYIETYRALLESFTSEQGARLRITDAASSVLDRRLESLRLSRNRLQQSQVTAEIAEIRAGADAATRQSIFEAELPEYYREAIEPR